MALSGLQIQKLLPKTNCKECGSNTCLAFAMKLAAKKASLDECPYASDEAKQILGADSEPPVAVVQLGSAKLGGETVIYRHEKTFVNQPVIAVCAGDEAAFAQIRDYKLERVGETLTIGAVAVTQTGCDKEAFAALCKKANEITGLPVIVGAQCDDCLEACGLALKGTGSVLCGISAANAEKFAALAKENGLLLALSAPDLDSIAALTKQLKEQGFNSIIMQLPTHSLSEGFQTNSIARRAAIKGNVKPMGYPTIKFIDTGDQLLDTAEAVQEINKYGGVIVLPGLDPAQLATLMALRLNIFTDPQKPIQVEPKVYAIGEPGRDSAVFVTTNFSLTYFLVSGEIENSGISAWLVIPECEGMSVLTAWAAGKFSGASIAKFIKEIDLESQVDTREIVIPGYVAQISGELEENLPGFRVLVGPGEAADLESYIKNVLVKTCRK
ncbi:MAG: acetyl-CoA decarbonylase/synthase complex subunit gamma [Clostridia bacterium]|nr:acetyl-CoA decarbonylase/synthase complex subunit gamma [Clostridia bacterium]